MEFSHVVHVSLIVSLSFRSCFMVYKFSHSFPALSLLQLDRVPIHISTHAFAVEVVLFRV